MGGAGSNSESDVCAYQPGHNGIRLSHFEQRIQQLHAQIDRLIAT